MLDCVFIKALFVETRFVLCHERIVEFTPRDTNGNQGKLVN